MGNRAVISFDSSAQNAIAIYVHWNGGRDSIEAFLKATRILMATDGRTGDSTYSKARFTQVVGLHFAGALSFGLGTVKELGGWGHDNGLYIIDSKTLTIKGRKFDDYYDSESFIEQDSHDLNEFTNDLINLINASYVIYNEGKSCPETLLPTAEEYDAEHPEEKKLLTIKKGVAIIPSTSTINKAVNH